MERLQKILSQGGVSSRRAGERLMLEGRVTVNGATIRELGTKADPLHDDIRVDGRRVKIVERHRYVLLNKPRGYVSTRSDPEKRPTVIDLLHGISEYIYPVGRLDFDSEGLLLLTNDGDLAARLTHPRHGVGRVYEARVRGVPDAHDLHRLETGMTIDGQRTAPADVKLVSPDTRRRTAPAKRPRASSREDRPVGRAAARPPESKATLVITIREGRNRQIRKMCEAIGHPVVDLKRVAIGPIRDPKLAPGRWRELRADEVAKLRAAAETRAPLTRGDRPPSVRARDRRESRG